jgi:hypothetical protein
LSFNRASRTIRSTSAFSSAASQELVCNALPLQ